jgi:Zn-dependent protease
MGKSLRLGRIFGIPVEINVTWVIIFLLLTYLLVNRFDASSLRWPATQQWAVAVVTVVLFFLSVLAHELSHSLVALSRGIRVLGITLFIFGGVSHLEREPERPSEEFLVAVVGPLTSLALAVAATGVLLGLNSGNWPWNARVGSPVEMVAVLLAWGNLSVGIFNLLPGFPLDGGRVLRAAVWAGSGSFVTATKVAARCGQGVGLLMIAGGIIFAIRGNLVDGIWAMVIGAFLLSVATGSYPRNS